MKTTKEKARLIYDESMAYTDHHQRAHYRRKQIAALPTGERWEVRQYIDNIVRANRKKTHWNDNFMGAS